MLQVSVILFAVMSWKVFLMCYRCCQLMVKFICDTLHRITLVVKKVEIFHIKLFEGCGIEL